MVVQIYNEIDKLIIALADAIKNASAHAIASRGQFNFVLSGGSSPKRLYAMLASEPYKSEMDWKNIYFFFGDERFVPENDAQRNSKMAKDVLFDPLKIAASHIFMVDTTGSPVDSAQNYAEVIETHFHKKDVQFDFVLLGLGGNSHTASLFPHTSVLEDTEATIKSVFVKEVDMDRITMTAPLINQARAIAFLVFGKDKAEAVASILEDHDGSPEQYPAKLISPKTGKLTWFLDREASNLLKKK